VKSAIGCYTLSGLKLLVQKQAHRYVVDSVYIVKYLQFWMDMYIIVIIAPDLSPILMVGYSCGKMQQIKNIAEWIRTA